MNQLQQFTFNNNGLLSQVRVQVDDHGQPWFVAKDVAELLGYADTAKAIRTHCKGVAEMATPSAGGEQLAKVIKESDVYRLIFRSQLPAAETFENWVVEEVLPAIRQQGFYQMQASVKSAAPIINLQKQALTLLNKLQKEQDPAIRQFLHGMLSNVSALLGQSTPPLLAIGKAVDPNAEPELAVKFFQYLDKLAAAGEQLNHSKNPDLIAINLPEFAKACAKHQLEALHNSSLQKALRGSKRLYQESVASRSQLTNSVVKCWVFNVGGEA